MKILHYVEPHSVMAASVNMFGCSLSAMNKKKCDGQLQLRQRRNASVYLTYAHAARGKSSPSCLQQSEVSVSQEGAAQAEQRSPVVDGGHDVDEDGVGIGWTRRRVY